MKTYVIFAAVCTAVMLTGCRTQTALVDYPEIQRLALASINERYPDVKLSDLRLDSVKSEMAANGSEVIQVDFRQPSLTKREKQSTPNGQQTEVTVPTVFVRLSNSGKIQDVGRGVSIGFQ